MKKELLLIYDKEERYARKLHEYVRARFSDIYETMLFTEERLLTEYLANEEADILLASEDYVSGRDGTGLPEYTICLTENREDIYGKSVYKYVPAHELFRQIMSICAAKETVDFKRKSGRKCMVLGVYSPIHRCFQTTFCLTTGQILAQMGKTLYLNFECFSGFDIFERNRNNTDLLDLLYYSEVNKGSFSLRVGSFAEHLGKLDYIPPVKAFTKYCGVNAEQWIRLIKTIESETDYEYLVLDLSEEVNGLLSILSGCDRIFTIVDEERIASSKMAQYEWLLRENNLDDILSKTEKIHIPVFREIPYEYEMLPYSDLAGYIRKSLSFMNEVSRANGD